VLTRRPIGAKTFQCSKSGVDALHFVLGAFALSSQLLDHDGQVSHFGVFSLGEDDSRAAELYDHELEIGDVFDSEVGAG
jgi:hypothetical protein